MEAGAFAWRHGGDYRRGVPWFAPDSFPRPVDRPILDAFDAVWDGLGRPGTWWTAAERLGIVDATRRAEPRGIGVEAIDLTTLDPAPAGGALSPLVHEVVYRVAVDAGRITADWAATAVDLLGPGPYTELVALVVQTVPVDRLCALLGRGLAPLPPPQPGDPTRQVPEGMGEGGAFVPWLVDGWDGPNVARALSYVPADNARRLQVVITMYSGGSRFDEMVWEHRALSRPQIELVAARTSAVNECFY